MTREQALRIRASIPVERLRNGPLSEAEQDSLCNTFDKPVHKPWAEYVRGFDPEGSNKWQ